MSAPLPTEEEFNEWLRHPTTVAVIRLLQLKREELRQQWEGGSFTDYDQGTTTLISVGNIGTCKGYAFVADLDYEQFTTEMESVNEQRERLRAVWGSSLD